eukprot:snap_masked-scaffold_18-processed-gene-5.28-mRNA-1 protein AED:1.00 eAED:1.00 QI:0/0/0/0/1/1/3/0/76
MLLGVTTDSLGNCRLLHASCIEHPENLDHLLQLKTFFLVHLDMKPDLQTAFIAYMRLQRALVAAYYTCKNASNFIR